ncbi:MAG: hypothetical protein MI723_13295, partial [Caulobacterales bacterium]|nr:hypothetical protein [Caulobacterales bacterium]
MIRCYNCFGVMNPDGDVLRCSRCGAVMDAVEDKAATVIAPQLGPSIDLRPVAIVLSLIIAAAVVGAGAYFLPEVFSPDAAEDGDPSLLGGSATEITSRPPPGGDSAVDLAQGRWTRVLGTVGGDRLMAMDLTGTGDVIVAARSTGELAPGGANAALLRLDARGELLLQADLPAFADARSLAIVAAPNEDVLVAGHVGDELVMERVGPAGVQRWRRRVASVADHRTGVAAALSGTDLVVAGPGRNASSARVLRMDADGYAEWQREFAIDVKAPFAGVAPASGEDVLVALTDAGDGAPYVRRLDSTGQVAWRRAISVTGGGELAGFIPTASEGAALVMEGFAPELALVDGDGGTVWVTALPPPASAAPLILARAGERL